MMDNKLALHGQSRYAIVRCSTRHALVFLAVALVLIALISAASAAGSQMWYLSGDGVMYKDTQGSNCPNALTVPQPANYLIFISDQNATTSVPFSGTWDFTITIQNAKEDHPFSAAIGEWDGATFTSAGFYNGTIPLGTNGEQVNFTIDATFTVHQGNWLAFRLQNTHPGGPGNQLGIIPCETTVSSPPTDPGYPVPELSTLVLMGVGLLALLGYFNHRVKRKRRH